VSRKKEGLSLRSRGKKPLTSLNGIFMEQLQNAPKEFLIRRLTALISKKAPNAPTDFAAAFARHLATTPAEPFTWSDGSDEEVDIEVLLTVEDLMPVFEEAAKFTQEEIPQIVRETLTSTAKVILKSLKADWPAQRAHDQARMAQFSANLHARWGDAFETLRMMYTIAVEVGGSIAKGRGRAKRKAVLNDTIMHLHARACQIVLEIITLMENGLADGAMARWRTLHEITVVATLLVEHGEELAIRYRSHEAVEAKRAMDRYVLHHEQLGYAPLTKKEIEQTEKGYKDSLVRFGENFGSEYGWAAHHLKIKKPRLVDLEAAVGQAAMQSYYRMASYNVHAGATGIGFRLGLLDGEGTPIALAGASNAGFVDPAQNAAYDLVHMTSLLADGTTRFDRMIEWEILVLLRDEILRKLGKAQRDLERSHRAQVKWERAARRNKRRPDSFAR
jgi:hypothetical protein